MRALIMLLMVGVFAAMAVTALSASLEQAGDDTTITNESWSPTAGSVTTLDDSNIDDAYYDESVTVYDDTNDVMSEGDDYIWYPGNGTVKTVTGGALDGDTSATITYGYQLTTDEQQGMASMLAQVPNAVGLAMPAFILIFLLVFVRGG